MSTGQNATKLTGLSCNHPSKVQDFMVGSRKTSFQFDHWPTCQ
jgi:hypothetical protein